MFPRTIENRLKMGRYVPILRHQSARIEPVTLLKQWIRCQGF